MFRKMLRSFRAFETQSISLTGSFWNRSLDENDKEEPQRQHKFLLEHCCMSPLAHLCKPPQEPIRLPPDDDNDDDLITMVMI